MKRGIIELTKEEVLNIVDQLPLDVYAGKPLANKLHASISSGIDVQTLEVSEDELELILDEIAIPSPDESAHLKSARKKMQNLLRDFREVNLG